MTITNPAHIGKCWCGDKPHADSVGDWESADHYLRHGRSPHSRPIAHNTRVLRLWDGDIGVRLHSTMVVVYPRPGGHSDPNIVAWLTLGGYNTKTTRDRVTEFTPARVGNRKGTWDHPFPYLWHVGAAEVTIISSEEAVAVNGAGELVASAWDYPMDTHVHKLARVHYVTTKAMPGGKKSATEHFPPEGKPDWLYKNHYGPHTKAPAPEPQSSPPNVDGNKVIAAMGSVVPDIGQTVNCPAKTVNPNLSKDTDCVLSKSLSDLIIHLNDTHRWSREAIADWLESLDLDLELRERSTA